jgi:hypothetical protein
MTHPQAEDPVIATAVLLRTSLVTEGKHLEVLARRLSQEAELLQQETVAKDTEGGCGDNPGS